MDGLFEDCLCVQRFHLEEKLIEKVDISILIKSSSKTNSGLHAGADFDTFLTDDGCVALWESGDVILKLCGSDHFTETTLCILQTEADIVTDGAWENEWILLYICDSAIHLVGTSFLKSLIHD